jgi:hypothetical protein
MNYKNIKINMKIWDSWYSDWGLGVVKTVLKTRFKVKFSNKDRVITYDNAHAQFIEKSKNQPHKTKIYPFKT